MSLIQSPGIVTNGLIFYYDSSNVKQWKGKPTTNFIYTQNPRLDTQYAQYSATGTGTWNLKHPAAIRVYNDIGSEITVYVNSGVSDWTNTYHAVWELDPELKMPVVVMRDYDAAWKAKQFSLGQTMSGMGLTYGQTYTLSWLQWTDNISKSVNAGLYGLNTGATLGFHDGLSQDTGAAAFNTKPYTWQRVYATFTVNASRDLQAGLSCYMYGHYNVRGVVKIADVQLETGTGSLFSKQQTRQNTQALLDLTGNNIITASSLTYNNSGQFSFDGVGNYLSLGNNSTLCGDSVTYVIWTKASNEALLDHVTNIIGKGNWNAQVGAYMVVGYRNATELIFANKTSWTGTNGYALSNFDATTWHQITCVSNTTHDICYINGQEVFRNQSVATKTTNTYDFEIGRSSYYANFYPGDIPIIKVYNRALSAAEISQNFNALRGRYGI